MDIRTAINILEDISAGMDSFDDFIQDLSHQGISKSINELQTAKPHTIQKFNTKEAFIQYMEDDLGFVLLGAGQLGIVFSHPKLNYVLKVYENDDGYDLFLNFVKSHQNCPNLPKIFGNVIKVLPTVKMVRMEKLAAVTTDQWDKFYKIDADAYLLINQRKKPETLYNDVDIILFKTLVELYKFGHGKKLVVDIHEDNVLARGETIVIIDPFVAKGWNTQPRTARGGVPFGMQ